MKRVAAFIAIGCLLSGHALADAPPIKFTFDDDSITRDDAKRAIDIFLENCSPLNKYLRDFQEINVRVGKKIVDYQPEMGWTSEIHIQMTVPDEPNYVPRYDPRTHVIAGHTLHYFIGGGNRPGIVGAKRSSQMLCGLPIDQNGSVTFKSVPDLSLIRYR